MRPGHDNATVVDHGWEISLAVYVLLNLIVFGSAWRFATRRITASRSQALLDAALIGYAIQYAAVGLPGVIGQLRSTAIAETAIALSVALILLARKRTVACTPSGHGRFSIILAVFTTAFVLAFAQWQASLPVISNDALTYHFPAAAQWLQHHRIDVYPTWFFNPTNTFSPLAGSTFVVWLLAPFSSDVLARFVEVPALLCVGIAVYRLVRELGVRSTIAASTAAAAVLCRPVFLQSMMAKDDLFLAFFFIAIMVALSKYRRSEPLATVRLGIALGLLLATKYTAFLAAPVLLVPLFNSPGRKAGDRPENSAYRRTKHILGALSIATLFAGPWYLRNWMATGNPVFPIDVSIGGFHLFHGLFTSAVSNGLRPFSAAGAVVVGGSYGLPTPVAVILGLGWVAGCVLGVRSLRGDPLLRTCVIGPLVGFGIFYWLSPFPEVRFIVPEFLLLFAVTGYAIEQSLQNAVTVKDVPLAATTAAVLFPLVSMGTIFMPKVWVVTAPLAIAPAILTCAAVVFLRFDRRAMLLTSVAIAAVFLGYVYVDWNAYCNAYRTTLHEPGSGYDQNYPSDEKLWRFVDQHVPADAAVAYTNLYMTYPLYGFSLQRKLVYAPTRPGVRTIADLPWLGDRLSGEKLVSAAKRATTEPADRAVWLANLRAARATYLIVGAGPAPETEFVRESPAQFRLLYDGPGGRVYAIDR